LGDESVGFIAPNCSDPVNSFLLKLIFNWGYITIYEFLNKLDKLPVAPIE
jgi:hypothetical protein